MRNGFSKDWEKAKLRDLVKFALGGDWGKSPDAVPEGFVKVGVIRGTDYRHWKETKGANAEERCIKMSSLEKRRLQEGDIVVEISGGGPDQPVGRTVIIDKEVLKGSKLPLVCSNFFRLVRLDKAVDARFVNYYLSHLYAMGDLNEFQTQTTNLRNLNFTDFLDRVNVCIAPIQEQRHIVAKLEKVLGVVENSQKRLAKIPVLLKRLRQSVLSAACSGRLTADLRHEVVSSDELPESWHRMCIGDVIQDLKYGTSKKCSYTKEGVPVLRIPNVVGGIIDKEDLKYAVLSEKEYKNLSLKEGDILIIRSNGSVSLVGRGALVRDGEEGFAYAGYLIRIRPNQEVVNPKYLNYVLQSYDVRLQIELQARSTSGVNNINSNEVRALMISLPPLDEQKEIVFRVETFFALIDKIETRYKKAQAHVDKLTQSVLAKAFRGELVPQDPNDEPASELLERMKKKRERL
jgi:type I restriction enzyme S subunit